MRTSTGKPTKAQQARFEALREIGCIACRAEGFHSEAEIHHLVTATQKKLVALMGEIACAESDVERFAASKFEKITVADLAIFDEAIVVLEVRGQIGACECDVISALRHAVVDVERNGP